MPEFDPLFSIACNFASVESSESYVPVDHYLNTCGVFLLFFFFLTYRNILTSSKRTHPFITELNYGFITIHWNEEPVRMVAFIMCWFGSVF